MAQGAIRKRVQAVLSKYGLDNKFSVRTVGFERDSLPVVTVKGWKPNKLTSEIKAEIAALPERPLVDFD